MAGCRVMPICCRHVAERDRMPRTARRRDSNPRASIENRHLSSAPSCHPRSNGGRSEIVRQILAAACLLAADGLALAENEFEHAAVYFEQNATDKDAEVVFEAQAGDSGLATLNVVASDGRTVINFKAPESQLGLRQLRFESPESESGRQV